MGGPTTEPMGERMGERMPHRMEVTEAPSRLPMEVTKGRRMEARSRLPMIG